MNPKTKIYYHGEQIYPKRDSKGKFSSFKSKFIKFMKKVMYVLIITNLLSWALIGAYVAGGKTNPMIVHAEKIIEIERTKIPAVMERIAKCESATGHYKDGQVVVNANTNGSTDIGKYQINSIWNKKATEMGLDLTKEADNEKFAMFLYESRGSEDWYSSKKCWQK